MSKLDPYASDKACYFTVPEIPDTLSICDDEIKSMFDGKAYDISLPIQAQLIKELRLLREAIENGPSYRD